MQGSQGISTPEILHRSWSLDLGLTAEFPSRHIPLSSSFISILSTCLQNRQQPIMRIYGAWPFTAPRVSIDRNGLAWLWRREIATVTNGDMWGTVC